ncbi:dephospho-CoA kinase [Rhizobium leguminosarum bv. trifolii CB782]|uniref:Dephospho-CoA kinase n=1 Tax=Rhizobium hidalgonense TaxID=1538159 RepID=A0ABX4JJE6_9HYPH|nr:dephospho-CoA kinase [Rhizobium hidalgonense]AHG47474.1 dephospho-CoA kinase [Rhizobium leguminosarum bv. trifolii CB782]EJC74919.1 dephospho-CoA kinase [Rhizobium leguminosarum bv. trifolii WSM2012]EJC74923.1 dephospho-CoA kinase [Rhizobium leguminosarum bv. trifolii WSM2012]MDR9814558.1 dephospho-CoA kinase [Rhizobium hidalgonense]PDT20124.1 dephospho-CoA kinase [Rhizobium hidalgonense]
MLKIGLTGSIGMGKSTAGKLFAEAGIPLNDSDAVVHDLYAGEAAPLVDAAFPGTMKDGAVDRHELGRQLALDPDGFKRLEAIVHPLVRKRETEFLKRQRAAGAEMVVLDIPLLFETSAWESVDVVVVVSAGPQIQRERVLARDGMTKEKFEMILSRQTPDAEKRRRADYLIDSSRSIAETKERVLEIIADLKTRIAKGDFRNA